MRILRRRPVLTRYEEWFGDAGSDLPRRRGDPRTGRRYRDIAWCLRCGTGWHLVIPHTTWYSGSSGCFPLCELCWSELTPHQRLPFYARLVQYWKDDPDVPDKPAGIEELVGAAVMVGG